MPLPFVHAEAPIFLKVRCAAARVPAGEGAEGAQARQRRIRHARLARAQVLLVQALKGGGIWWGGEGQACVRVPSNARTVQVEGHGTPRLLFGPCAWRHATALRDSSSMPRCDLARHARCVRLAAWKVWVD